ncbi:5864_t:CDS:2 [Diversispora eburnea]|uniref:Postreplication repair E3 ubiquitin-protein ligase RAD18 n=1 Tax=Diversispora eburnea TaxID=1213867 RepID=A0A9N8VCJ5_9GLOM|nr:5864_t:CDS:2 [Diversispora eburnea]
MSSHVSATTSPLLSPQDSPKEIIVSTQPESFESSTFQQSSQSLQSLQSVPSLPIEQYLRCPICKDYYDLPISTKCQHTFCAGCMKCNYENKDTAMECPVCGYWFKTFTQMCKNTVIEDFLREYKNLSSTTIRLYKLGLQMDNEKCNEDNQEIDISKTKISSQTSKIFQQSILKNSMNLSNSIMFSLDSGSQELKRSVENYDDDIPTKRLKSESSDSFFFNKKGNFNNKTANKKPKLVYCLIKDKSLKNMMKEEGLSLNGNRIELIKRHSYFTYLWNSNVDATNPKTKESLIKEVQKWERTQQNQKRIIENNDSFKRFLNTEEEIKSYDILLMSDNNNS